MPPNNRNLIDLSNVLCRICAREEPNSISIFGPEGQRQNLIKKIRICLPVDIRENDILPKNICLTCLTKLDSFWDMHVLCKESQQKIETKFSSLMSQKNLEQENSAPIPEDTNCGVCNKEVHDNQLGIGCEGLCQKWFHCYCIKMNREVYDKYCSNPVESWICQNCCKKVPRPKICIMNLSIEERLRNLTERYPVSYGDSAVICLAPESTSTVPQAPSTITREQQVIPRALATNRSTPSITYITTSLVQPPASTPQQPPSEEVYPQSLIQVPQNPASEPPVVYRNCAVPGPSPTSTAQSVSRRMPQIPKPMAPPPAQQRPSSTPLKRKNGETTGGQSAKKLCRYCNKWFIDDIIDHHISLHLRQTFRTCLDCNKNFRSEEALERHRCGVNETIDLDPDDDEETIVL